MPSTSEKQRKFFGAVMGAKKGSSKVSGKAKKVAKEMPEKEIKHFLKKEDEEMEEDAESTLKKFKKTKGKLKMKKDSPKERKHFAPETKTHKVKKGKGSYDRQSLKREMNETFSIENFIESLMRKNYASAHKYLNKAIEFKIQKKIGRELKNPLF